jgi:hypothetical protein|tara:strand:- start:497 stop:679 length:183 start_codon:yes stop_codon:yes gene_type:complete
LDRTNPILTTAMGLDASKIRLVFKNQRKQITSRVNPPADNLRELDPRNLHPMKMDPLLVL